MKNKTSSIGNFKPVLQSSSELKAISKSPYSRLCDGLDDELVDYPLDEASPETYDVGTYARVSAILSDNILN